jgi:hypothetical protein
MNPTATSQLEKIAGRLANNDIVPPMTVRDFLGLLGEEPRRGTNVIKRVRNGLVKHQLTTQPDFGNGDIEKLIEIVLAAAKPMRPATERRILRVPAGRKKKPTSKLDEIAGKLAENRRVPTMSVRTFLGLFGQERRGFNVVKRIRKELKKHKLVTQPDFENENIDNQIKIILVRSEPQPVRIVRRIVRTAKDQAVSLIPEPQVPPTEEPSATEPRNSVVTIRQGIPSAGKSPATVRPDEITTMALTRLMSEKLELLVVQSGDRARVDGVFSYASFAHAHMAGKPTETVRDCISNEFIEVNEERPLIDAVREILQHKTVVVRSRHNNLCGMVTARDVAPVFIELAEPFLLLGQIENHMRGLLERAKLKKDEYQSLVIESDSGRKARTEGPDDLTLGELIVAFESPAMWEKIGIHFDKVTFTKRLHGVREIRNKVMHFSPDGLPPDDVAKLKEARELLEKL